MRSISHMDLSAVRWPRAGTPGTGPWLTAWQMNPFMSFCLYVAARVFVQYLKSRPDDAQTTDSLRFLLAAMSTLKRRNPLTESFLVQLDVDFEALAARIPKLRNAFPRPGDNVSPPWPRAMPRDPDAQQHGLARTGKPSTARDDPDGLQSILAFGNDCRHLYVPGDDGGARDLAEAQCDGQGPNPDGFGQAWLSADQSSMPGLTPGSGPVHEVSASTSGGPLSGFGEGAVDEAETRVSPEVGQSSRPTPQSSGTGGSDGRARLATGRPPGSGAGGEPSFRAGLMSPQQGMMGPGAVDFFGGPGGFAAMGGGLGGGPQAAAGPGLAPDGWADLGGQASGVPPLGEGVLRALMNMGPMDAMDLSSWDPGNDSHMRGG